ncbi:hypothetical protein IZ6_19060 [Terrihabitans soli]|uniref:Uncharacterized protein n=1 Tax=Terrihabitans soli TaxID=708113 RepID=A0A6S6QVT3_9HYPH|nr:hypothetical protein [Terrihabitans soli]BCJ91171.1 hypothetical protein IZ6_19060 [Terrihabitans soli]
MIRSLTALSLMALTTPAFADRAEADLCAKNLTEPAISVYNFGISKVEAKSTLEQAVRPYLEPLVQSNKMTEQDARKHGRAAAECLRLVHRKEQLPPQ